ncbi:MAG: class I SAM-dependent methyltransferase [Patescibacteria group bacterium]
MLDKYYNDYWQKRIQDTTKPIPDGLPKFLKKYTSYGAIVNCLSASDKLLDIGCGDGRVSELYKEKAAKVYGLDISGQAISEAKKRGIEASFQDLNQLPLKFEDGYFDCVVLTDVVEHVINPLGLLQEVKRILKADGQAVVTVPNFARLSNRLKMLIGDPIDILHWSKYGDEIEHLHWFTWPKLKNLFKDAGFSKLKPIPTGLKSLSFVFGLVGLYNLGSYLTIKIKK